MDIHECKWMRTGGTPILGNLHIYIYLFIYLFIYWYGFKPAKIIMIHHVVSLDMCCKTAYSAYRTRIDPANDLPQHDLTSHLSLWFKVMFLVRLDSF
jgi:hypothetical protein